MNRSLSKIAYEIQQAWPNPYFGARPYIQAMKALNSIEDSYYYDSGRSIVLYFLSNAQTWRGPDAKQIGRAHV